MGTARPVTVRRTAVTAAVVAALLAAAAAEVSIARLLTGRASPEVYSFGVKGPTDVELFRQVVKKRLLPAARLRADVVRYPAEGVAPKSIVTYVEVAVPRRLLLRDEVRVTGGGPGQDHVAVSVGGRLSLEYTVVVYGQDGAASKGGKRLTTTTLRPQAPQTPQGPSAAADSVNVVQAPGAVLTAAGAAVDRAGAGDDSAQVPTAGQSQNLYSDPQ